MDTSVNLSDDDRKLLREVGRAVGFPSQKQFAQAAEVEETWLSQVLTGRRKKVNAELLERVAKVLVERLKSRRTDDSFPEGRVRVALTSLGRFTSNATASIPPTMYPPGGLVSVDSAHYVRRGADDQTLEALRIMPFTMLVRGPVQCGKSSLLARLEHKAREVGVETFWFDHRVPISASQITKHDLDVNAVAAMSFSESLQAEWGLEPRRDEPIDSIPRLVNWLVKALRSTASKPRLLILDDLANLGARAAEDWLSLFVRAMHNKRATGGPQVSIAVGVTHHFGTYFSRKLLELSSVVHWWPRIELEWFKTAEVTELADLIPDAAPQAKDILDLLAGQPYLTHAALADTTFHEALRRWTANRSKDSAKPVIESLVYKRHLDAIRAAILGPTLRADDETFNLLQAFVDACAGQTPKNEDHKLFLETAKLVAPSGKPELLIYGLIADDLMQSVRR